MGHGSKGGSPALEKCLSKCDSLAHVSKGAGSGMRQMRNCTDSCLKKHTTMGAAAAESGHEEGWFKHVSISDLGFGLWAPAKKVPAAEQKAKDKDFESGVFSML
eukprot:TRINITY_DN10612_c0_g1_i1.p2 TRINITY_DN10612_c0_g1~~TRINITY_DN10612_c0_g1_i1.p2  ORF type:complete len:104 (+),score=23.38 TRINITY_DN10612_c0_g1_i1:137-448(+)